MSSMPTNTTEVDLAAVAEALQGNDRFIVTTHENPDGERHGYGDAGQHGDPDEHADPNGRPANTWRHGCPTGDRGPDQSAAARRVLLHADADADRDDADADDSGLQGAELLQRELGATVIEEIPHE